MKYQTFTRSRKINSVKREIKRIGKKTARNYQGVEKKKLLFGKEG